MAKQNTAPAALYEPLYGSPRQGTYVLISVYQARTTVRRNLARENTTPCRLDSPPSGRPWQGELRVATSLTAPVLLPAVHHPEVSAVGERMKCD